VHPQGSSGNELAWRYQ